MKKCFILLIFVAFFVNNIISQDLPLLAVPGITGTDVSPAAASTCRNMVETALLKTGHFSVLSYTDMEEILAAQAFTLTGCTDESCAVEIGKLLAAENIVVGELTGLGEGFVLSIRMVNVSTGKTIKAEIQNIDSLEDLQQKTFEASFRLAGLVYIAGVDRGVTQTGSIYVMAPGNRELDVFLDGINHGVTPVLIEDIEFGSHVLEVKRDSYLFEQEIVISTKDIQEIIADVKQLEGNLLLTILPPSAEGYKLLINSESTLPGLIRGVAAGDCKVVITGNGWEYNGSLKIEPDENNKFSITLSKVGSVKVNVPVGSEIVLSNDTDEKYINAGKILSLSVGNWLLSISNSDFEDFERQVVIDQGKLTSIDPILNHTELFTLYQKLEDLNVKRKQIVSKKDKFRSWEFATGIAAIVGGGLIGVFEWLIPGKITELDDAYAAYSASTVPAEAASLWSSVETSQTELDLYRIIRTSSIGLAAVTGITTGVLFITQPSTKDVDIQIQEIQGRIDSLD